MRTKFEHRIIDTSFLIALSRPYTEYPTLEEACERCGVEITNRHNALGDSIMTAYVWSYYLKKAKEMGFHSLFDIYEYLSKLK